MEKVLKTIVLDEPMPLVHTPREDTVQKRREKNAKYVYSLIYDLDNLKISFRRASKGCRWKRSVQAFDKNLLYNLMELSQELQNGTYKQSEFNTFTINERGKPRLIKAMKIRDRVVQRTLADFVLVPVITDYLIYDNGASLEEKGIDFCRRRFEEHMRSFYRKHGPNGYILKIDFSKFFDNLLHSYAKQVLYDLIEDENIRKLIDLMIDSFQQDVSYMDDDEYAQCLVTTFNSLDYQFLSKGKQTGEKWMPKSVGIGSHISQICGILYLNEIDQFCKVVKSMKYYGRYMDDIYIIHEDKDFLLQLLQEIDAKCQSIGLHINKKKTQVMKITKGITFLQTKYNFDATGHLVKRPTSKTFKRIRKKIKSYERLLEQNRITYLEVAHSYKSWRGSLEKYDCYKQLQVMDDFFYQHIGYTADQIEESFHQVYFFPEYNENINRRDFYTEHRPINVRSYE